MLAPFSSKKLSSIIPIVSTLVVLTTQTHAQNDKQKSEKKHSLDIETAVIFSGYNDVAIPNNDSGSRFSFTDDLKSDPTIGVRFRYGYQFTDKHWGGLLIAPLTVRPKGKFDRDIKFRELTYNAGEDIDAKYMFNSYRLIYRYTVKDNKNHKLSLGGALKIRDADITLDNNKQNNSKKNIGFVPLLSFNYTYKATDTLGLMIDGEALGAKQGRAEDVFFGAKYQARDNVAVKAGYRVLEGGADNETVYGFALFHYASLGVIIDF